MESIADAMFALSSTSSVRILMLLRERPCTVCELTEATGMEQSAVSHQLRVLREHRIVSVERIGRRRRYDTVRRDVATLLDAALHHIAAPCGPPWPPRRRLMAVDRGDFTPPAGRRAVLDRAHVGDVEGAFGTLSEAAVPPARGSAHASPRSQPSSARVS